MIVMNIKDYLHLYLGCPVWICKNIEGNDVIELLTTKMLYEDEEMFDELDMFKPILRPLSDMTEQERRLTGLFNNLEHCKRWCKNNEAGKHPFLNSENMRFLISKQFDLFGLIDAGLAIDKTTLK